MRQLSFNLRFNCFLQQNIRILRIRHNLIAPHGRVHRNQPPATDRFIRLIGPPISLIGIFSATLVTRFLDRQRRCIARVNVSKFRSVYLLNRLTTSTGHARQDRHVIGRVCNQHAAHVNVRL